MDAKRRVLGALEELQGELRTIRMAYSAERWERLRLDLAALLDAVKRAGAPSDWEELALRLDALRDRHGLPRASTGEDDDPYGYENFQLKRSAGPYRGALRAAAVPGRDSMDVVASLGKLIEVERRAPITTYPSVEAPEEVVEKTAFYLDVTAKAEPPDGKVEPLTATPDEAGNVDLEVVVELPADGSITARSQLAQSLRVPEYGDSVTLRFRLFAERPGKRTLVVRIRHQGQERTVIRRAVGVATAAEAATSPPLAAVGQTSAPVFGAVEMFTGLRLVFEERSRDRGDAYCCIRLEGPETLLPAPVQVTHSVKESTSTLLAKLCHDMGETMPLQQEQSRELRIQNIGAGLSGKLLPDPIRRALAAAPEGTALHVEADDAWVPWELLWLPGTGFLGERFALTRWLRSGSKRDRLPGGKAILVAHSDPKPGVDAESAALRVDAERAAIEAVSGAPPQEVRLVGDVMERLAAADPIGFLHFACHGVTPENQPLGGMLKLDGGSLRQNDVRDPEVQGTAPLAGACVFLNACEAGLAERALSGHGGWAEVLLRARAGAVIAPVWSVWDSIAAPFAKHFYEQLRAGETVGEAARRARVAVRRNGDPDRLCYAVYASPVARLARGVPPRP